jgi:hypothetical protein
VRQRAFELWRDDELVAKLVVEGHDWPWTLGRVEPLPAFEALRPQFAGNEGGLGRLVDPDGGAVSVLLHIEGNNAWWR